MGLAVAMLGVAVLCPTAGSSVWDSELHMQARLDQDGSGRLYLNNARGPVSWEACAPDLTDCIPFRGGRQLETGNARPGTVFRAESNGAVGVSPEWLGRLKRLTPPMVSGIIRANEFVVPVPGKWRGGWKDGDSEMQLAACPTPTAVACTTLTDFHYLRPCPMSASVALDPRFAGSYLRVADWQIGPGPHLRPAYAVSSPYGGKVWRRNRITSVAIVGQIAAPVRASQGECGPPPRSRASISRLGVVTVECRAGCGFTLLAGRQGRRVRVERNLRAQHILEVLPPTELRLTRQQRALLGEGRVRMLVKIDGRRSAARTVPLNGGRSR